MRGRLPERRCLQRRLPRPIRSAAWIDRWRGAMNVKACARRLTAACLGLLAIAAAAQAQQYPNRPATIISDSAAGSTPDAVLRVIADQLGQIWGQQVLAVNHPGATGSCCKSRSVTTLRTSN